jgi:hypothetical protein
MSLDSILQSFYDDVLSGACCSSCSSCDAQTQCAIHAAVTQTCAIQNVQIMHCNNVNVSCCNSNAITILTCPSETALQQYAANAVEQAIAEKAGLAAEIRAFLERNQFLTPAEAIELGLTKYFSTVCSASVISTQTNTLPLLTMYDCSDILIELFNRSDVTIQCVVGALSNLIYPTSSAGPVSSTPPIAPLARNLGIAMAATGLALILIAIGFAVHAKKNK